MSSGPLHALRLAILLAFVLASFGSHGSVRAGVALDFPSFPVHAGKLAIAPQHAAPCRQAGDVYDRSCCILGQCMLGILWPPASPLPQPEPLKPAVSPVRTLAGASPETPYRPPA
jgi:hypothetical protein